MWLDQGVWKPGSPPRNKVADRNRRGSPRIVDHQVAVSIPTFSGSKLDRLLSGEPRLVFYRSIGGLGDIIMMAPIAKGAKRKYPGSHVTYALPIGFANGDAVAFYENNPFIDEIIDFSLCRRSNYDLFVDLTASAIGEERSYTSPRNRIDIFAADAGIPLYGDYIPSYFMTEEEDQWGKDFIERSLPKDFSGLKIALHLKSSDSKRSWGDDKNRQFIVAARESGHHIFLTEWGLSPSEWIYRGSTQVFNYPLRQVAAIYKHCDILVCPDSSMLHLGAALNMRTVALLGSQPASCRVNRYPRAVAVVNDQVTCLGCIWGECTHRTAAGGFYCMASLQPIEVLRILKKVVRNETFSQDSPLSLPIISSESSKRKRFLKTFRI